LYIELYINVDFKSYLNADGFLGGLTLSRENIRLRPEYEDILRFYGFDLSSIEQEANVTVSMGDSSSITELPTSTIGLTTLSTEMANIGNVPNMTTTTSTGTITTFPPADAETTVVPSTTASIIQQTVTMTPTVETDVQLTLTPITSTEIVAQSTSPTQSANSLTITSGESVQPTSSAETSLPYTITSMVNTDNQTIPITTIVAIADNQTFSTVAASDTETSTSVPNESVQVSTRADTTTATVIVAGVTESMSTDVQVPSTFATEVPMTTNMISLDSSAMIAVDANIDALTTASTVNMMPIDTTIPNATLNTVTMNSLTTMVSAILNGANVTIPSPVTKTMMVNGVISQSTIETSADTPIGNTPGMTTANDLAMTTNIDSAVNFDTVIPSVSATNVTSSNLGNNFTITNSTMSSMDNQMTVSLVDGNTISMNRKKKNLIDIVNSNTVKDKLRDESSNIRKRETRSPREYFSSYPGN